jgi:hypothetical protein
MNTKINKILSVLATVAIVASTFVWAIPVAASVPGDGTFSIQDLPATGTAGKFVILDNSQIIDIAVGSDGKTIYVANAESAANWIMKSTDAGQSFDTVTNNYGAAGVTPAGGVLPVAMAIAPDDVQTVAVTDGIKVIITKDGGTTWSALPNPVLAGAVITDIAVAPARSGTLLGREYIISIANAGVILGGGPRTVVATTTTAGAWSAGAGIYTMTYTNQAGTAGKIATITIPAATIAGTNIAITLAAGDTGILDITAIINATGNAAAAADTFAVNAVGLPAVAFGAVTNGPMPMALPMPPVLAAMSRLSAETPSGRLLAAPVLMLLPVSSTLPQSSSRLTSLATAALSLSAPRRPSAQLLFSSSTRQPT